MPTVIEIDCSTGESIEREMTAEEVANMEAMQAEQAARQAEAEAEATRIADLKASAKAKLVAGTPLTEEEASVITL